MIMYIITFKIKDLEKKKELNNNMIKKLKLANIIILISIISSRRWGTKPPHHFRLFRIVP